MLIVLLEFMFVLPGRVVSEPKELLPVVVFVPELLIVPELLVVPELFMLLDEFVVPKPEVSVPVVPAFVELLFELYELLEVPDVPVPLW